MSDIEFTASDLPTSSSKSARPNRPVERKLVMRPESFFSHRFRLEVEEADGSSSVEPAKGTRGRGLDRLIDLNILLLILLVGVTVLLYCVLSAVG